jgi:hypothetical protein
MNDIAAPILLVFIADKLGLRVPALEKLSESPEKVDKLTEILLLEVQLISQKRIAISVLQTFWLP